MGGECFQRVMAGLDPAIHAFLQDQEKTWMRGSSPRMTMGMIECFPAPSRNASAPRVPA
jgi:hypothetical protein